MKIFSILILILSIVYIIVPIDYDGTIIGYIDDFMFFMSAFCFVYAHFVNNYSTSSGVLLKMFSVIFCFLGAVSLLLLALMS